MSDTAPEAPTLLRIEESRFEDYLVIYEGETEVALIPVIDFYGDTEDEAFGEKAKTRAGLILAALSSEPSDKAVVGETGLPTNPYVGEGMLWNGVKWLEIAPSMEAVAVVALSKESERAKALIGALVEALENCVDTWSALKGDPEPWLHQARAAIQRARSP